MARKLQGIVEAVAWSKQRLEKTNKKITEIIYMVARSQNHFIAHNHSVGTYVAPAKLVYNL